MKKSILAGLLAVATTAAFAQTSPGTPPSKPAEAAGYASPNPADKAAGSAGTKGSAAKGSTAGTTTTGGTTSGSGMSSGGSSSGSMSTGSTSTGSRSSTGATSGSTGTAGAGTPPKEPAAASGYASPVPADQKAGSGKK